MNHALALPPAHIAAIDELDRLRTRPDAWQVPRAEGELLCHLALGCLAKTIVEVGTSYGFSALWWAAALRHTGGRLHTVDIDPKKYESSRATFESAGVADLITSYLGDAKAILTSMPAPIDIAFIDADKPACQTYLDLLWPKLRIGGAVLTDNITSHPEQLGAFAADLRARPDAHSLLLPVGNGVEWTIKLR